MNNPDCCGAFLGRSFNWIPEGHEIIAYIIKENPFDEENISRIKAELFAQRNKA